MSDPCRDWRVALGAAALGQLDPAEEIGLRAHLDGCPECRAELRELTAVANALASVPVENITSAAAEPSDALAGRILGRVALERGVRRNRRTRRVAAGVSSFVAAAAAVIAVVLFVGGGTSPGTRVVIPGVGHATATATLTSASAGTEIDMKVAGLKPGHYYWLWLTGEGEKRMGAGTFKGTTGQAELKLTAAIPLSEADRIWVTDDKKHVVLDKRLSA
jgi:predicted anti-sigma-YlaC factor YlaD